MTNLGLLSRSCPLLAGLLALQVLGAGCFEGECSEGGDPDPDAVEEAVWAAMLDYVQGIWTDYTPEDPLLLQPYTTKPWEARKKYVLDGFQSMDPAVYEDFEEKNEVSVDLPGDLATDTPYEVLEEVPHWKKKVDYAALSRPGIDGCRSQALMYWEFYCGVLCAWGDYLLLEWNDGEWTIAEELEDWES